jgi:O-antigen ligase
MYNISMKKIDFKYNMASIREGVLKYGICVLALLLPLVVFINYFFYYISSKTFFLYGFISVLFPIWLYTIYTDKSYRLSKKQLLFFIPLIIYVFWMTLSGIMAVNPHLAFWSTLERGTGIITLYFAFAGSLIVSSLVKRHGHQYLYLLLKYLLVSSFILAISVWLSDRGVDLPFLIFKYSSGGGLAGNPSISSAFFVFAFFSGIYLLFSKGISKNWKIAISVILATILLSPSYINIYSILTHKDLIEISKGSFLSIFVGLGVIGVTYLLLSKNKKIRNIGIVTVFISLVVFSIGWASFVKPGTYLHDKFTQVALESRFIFWDIAQKSIDEHPYLGYGPENYSIAFNNNFDPKLFKDEYYNETIIDKAHNVYFDTGVSGGYPLILMYTFVFLGIFYAVYTAYNKKKITKLQAGIFGGLMVAYIFQNLFSFDSNVSIFYFFVFIGIIFGLQEAHKTEHEEEIIKSKNINDKNLNLTLSILLVILSGVSIWYFVVLPSRKAILMQNVVVAYFNDDKSQLYENLLIGSSIGNDKDVASLADIIFANYSYNLTNSVYKESDIPNLLRDVIGIYNYLDSVAKTNKTDLRLQVGLLRFNSIYYFINGKEISNNSLKIIESSHKLSPTNPEIYWWEAQIHFWHGDIDNAVESYKKAIALNPNFIISHKIFIQFASDIRDKKLYEEALIQAKKDIPDYNFDSL